MKAVQIHGTPDSNEVTVNSNFPQPVPKAEEILIKVYAAGITADEKTWPELHASQSRIPGHDISGVVEALGPDYKGPLLVGDAVYAMLNANTGHGQAEYAIALPDEVALKPASISHAEAAALPIPILTAWQMITEHAKLKTGSTVLVTGASGAVGVILVQLAQRLAGAEVVSLASPRKHEYVKNLGAKDVVDYAISKWDKHVGRVDAVFDTVGGIVLAKAWNVVANDGTIVTVADPPPEWAFDRGQPKELATKPNVRWTYFIVCPQAANLTRASQLIDEGTLAALPVQAFPVDRAVEAWDLAGKRNRDAKIVLEFV